MNATRLLTSLVSILVFAPPGIAARPPPLATLATATSQAVNPTDMLMRVGVTRQMFRNANVNDATAAYRIFLESLAKDHGFNVQVESEFFADSSHYEAALNRADAPLHLVVIGIWDFLNMQVPANIEPKFVVTEGDTPGRRYALVVQRDGPIQTLADLRGAPLLQLEMVDNRLGRVWIETILAESGLPAADDFFSNVKEASKPTNTILPVFFGTAPVCFVDEPSFDLMSELNPQVGKTLRVLARSEPLGDVVVCLNTQAWPTPSNREVTIKAIADIESNPTGQQILTLFKIARFIPFTDDHLATTRDLRARWLAQPRELAP